MKLESLKDRPATFEDIGKSIWDRNSVELIIDGFINDYTRGHSKEWNVDYQDGFIIYIPEYYFWQKPIILSEKEYLELKQDISDMNNAYQTIYTRCPNCKRIHEQMYICPRCHKENI